MIINKLKQYTKTIFFISIQCSVTHLEAQKDFRSLKSIKIWDNQEYILLIIIPVTIGITKIMIKQILVDDTMKDTKAQMKRQKTIAMKAKCMKMNQLFQMQVRWRAVQ